MYYGSLDLRFCANFCSRIFSSSEPTFVIEWDYMTSLREEVWLLPLCIVSLNTPCSFFDTKATCEGSGQIWFPLPQRLVKKHGIVDMSDNQTVLNMESLIGNWKLEVVLSWHGLSSCLNDHIPHPNFPHSPSPHQPPSTIKPTPWDYSHRQKELFDDANYHPRVCKSLRSILHQLKTCHVPHWSKD